jgi:hypothetical protein
MSNADRRRQFDEAQKRDKNEMNRRRRFNMRREERNNKTHKAIREWKKALVEINEDPNIVNRGGVPTNASTNQPVVHLERKRQAFEAEAQRVPCEKLNG